MPYWAQVFSEFIPIKYVVEVMLLVIFKGSGRMENLPQTLKIFICNINDGLTVWSYKKKK